MFRTENLRTVPDCFQPAGGAIWQQLHSERDLVCEALLSKSVREEAHPRNELEPSDESLSEVEHRTFEILQSRLCELDNAMDRLMSGSYGICPECGRHIERTRLENDSATTYCRSCQSSLENPLAS